MIDHAYTPLCRVFRRRVKPINESFDTAFDVDHAVCPDAYDAFNLQAAYDQAVDELVREIAERYQVNYADLHKQLDVHCYYEEERYFDAIFSRGAQA